METFGPSGLEQVNALRRRIRDGHFDGPTADQAPGFVQGNLVILPEEAAFDFLRFCQANPRPCPLLAVSEPGDPRVPVLGEDIDLRHDLPRYRVFREGKLVEQRKDIADLWRDDLVGFVIGCSFSFEEALLAEGVPVRHVLEGRNVAMYRTNRPTTPAGRFSGPLVVSMRSFTPENAIRAVQITSRYPAVHGAPVHLGFPEQIGIEDLGRPDYGDPPNVRSGEIPVFWACGVTPQAALEKAGLPFAITHEPGHMLITDIPNARLAAF